MIGTDINYAAKILQQGQVVAIPTETVYGLAANAYNLNAVLKVYEIKKRPKFNPLIVHIHQKQQLNELVSFLPTDANILIDAFWPGPLTLLLPKTNLIEPLVTAGSDRVAIRMPNHAQALQLLKSINFPLVAPSANPFTYVSPTTAQHVNQQLGNKISYILDGGPCTVGIESTIVGFEQNKTVIYRKGGLTIESIESVLGKKVFTNEHTKIEAPGMLSVHYSPNSKIILGNIIENIQKLKPQNFGILSYTNRFDDLECMLKIALSHDGNLNDAAKNLFSALRTFDEIGVKQIFAERVPDIGLGVAINDRLERAAAEKN